MSICTDDGARLRVEVEDSYERLQNRWYLTDKPPKSLQSRQVKRARARVSTDVPEETDRIKAKCCIAQHLNGIGAKNTARKTRLSCCFIPLVCIY